MTNIFGNTPCIAYATKSKTDGTIRLFLATDGIDLTNFDPSCIANAEAQALLKAGIVYLPFVLYKFRWAIETVYFEQKKSWGFQDYKLRSKGGIEALIALQTLAYGFMSILPYLHSMFKSLEPYSIQERRFLLGDIVKTISIFRRFESDLETGENSISLIRHVLWVCRKVKSRGLEVVWCTIRHINRNRIG